MTETSLRTRGNLICTIRVEASSLRGDGGREYPRLIIPTRLDFSEIGNRVHFLFSIQTRLFLPDPDTRIADGLVECHPVAVRVPFMANPDFEFPLDLRCLERMEQHRRGDQKLRVYFNVLFVLLDTLQVQQGVVSHATKEVFQDFERQEVFLDITVPQSHWTRILPSLGWNSIDMIEIPIPSTLSEEFGKSADELQHARSYFVNGDYDKTVEHCRNAIEPVKVKLPELKKMAESETAYEWVREIGISTCEWIDKIYKKTRDLSAKPHHIPSMGHFDRHEAQTVLMFTVSFLAYLGRLLRSE